MEHDSTLYVGLDVHKESITATYALGMGEVELLAKVGTTKTDIDRLCKRLQSKASRIRIVYEAGPCGYGLYRQLQQKGVDCMVCAPSLIPRKPGERVKTDRRDAIKLVFAKGRRLIGGLCPYRRRRSLSRSGADMGECQG